MNDSYKSFVKQAGDTTVADAVARSNTKLNSHWQACADIGFKQEWQSRLNSIPHKVDFYQTVSSYLPSVLTPEFVSKYEGLSRYNEDTIQTLAIDEMKQEYGGDFLSQLSVGSGNYLLDKMFGHPDLLATTRLVQSSTKLKTDAAFEVWNNNKTAEFLEALGENVDIQRLRSKWVRDGDISKEEKQVLAETVHKLHANTYNYDPVPVNPKSERKGDLKEVKEGRLDEHSEYAYYDDRDNLIVYNDLLGTEIKGEKAMSVDEFIDSLAHESQHAFQYYVLRRMKWHIEVEEELNSRIEERGLSDVEEHTVRRQELSGDNIKENWKTRYEFVDNRKTRSDKMDRVELVEARWNENIDPLIVREGELRNYAEILRFGHNHYISSKEDYDGYKQTPLEVDAWSIGDNVTKYLASSPEERKQMIEGLRAPLNAQELGSDLPNYTEDQMNMTCEDLSSSLKFH